jgi:HD-GYP domain-containing protein (c-di-GMP phosphodiesterase class II)
MLARVSVLGPSREIAARHHERPGGSSASLTPSGRLLAAADAYHAMTEPRPHRAQLDPDRAFRDLRAEAIAGRLDGTAVDAVLTAAGHRAPARTCSLAGSPHAR